MAELNDFMTRIDLSVLNDYVAANGKSVVYAKGERIVQQGRLCRYVGVVKSGYFKYVALNSKGQEVVTGFSFEGEVVTDYVQGFLYDQPSLTSIVAGCDAEVQRVSVEDATVYHRAQFRLRGRGFLQSVAGGLLPLSECACKDSDRTVPLTCLPLSRRHTQSAYSGDCLLFRHLPPSVAPHP